jgi:predicted RNA-binding Zn-ribbon protein involved in translation (DUF1610 family)
MSEDASRTVGRTTDGIDIVDGLAVITNEFRVGVVRLDRPRALDDGWFDVEYADGRRVMQNGERIATRFRDVNGNVLIAADEWATVMFPCQQCGHNVAQAANACAENRTFEFTCPACGFVDHI